MTKLFFILLFAFLIAETIIAVIAVLNICKLNKAVKKLNCLLTVKRPSIQFFFMDLRAVFEDFALGIENFKKYIKEKKTLYIYNFIKTAVIYLSIFSLKGKYKKAVIAVQLAKEVYEAVREA